MAKKVVKKAVKKVVRKPVKKVEPVKPVEPAGPSLVEDWGNLNYVINVFIESRSDETLGKLKDQLRAFNERIGK